MLPPTGRQSARCDLTPSGEGFRIECKYCKRPFVSKGLRCCSAECERRLKDRRQVEAVVAERDMEAMPKRFFNCEHCGIAVPRWRNGRTVSKSARFCSPSCAKKAARLSRASREEMSASLPQKPLQDGGSA